jgi:hypothetical protein
MAHDPLLTAFVIITGLAFVAQAAILYGMYRAILGSRREFEALRTDMKQRFDPLAQSLTEVVRTSREPIRSITTNLADITRILHQRADYVDTVVADLADRSRLQIIRIDQMITDLVQKAQNTAGLVERTIITPIQEVSALIKGVRAALDFLVGRRHSSRSEVTQDEQMFI